MSAPTCQELRSRFLRYFEKNGHTIVPSSPVVPLNDPTLLFNNAGMNQFKDVFLGNSTRDYQRAVTSQKCIRAGGKHNDLENVGHTQRHMTFFEMLGNFSFGDYFKKEAIRFAWELSTEVFQFAPEKIFPTVFRDDDEAFELWTSYVPADRITRFDEKENFWAMGDTGPCGPCSELYFDRGEKYGTAPLSADPDSPRYLEFWNLVFMQYNRSAEGVLTPLPNQSVDTGSGLERVASLLQGTETVFEIDLLRHIIAAIEQRFGMVYDPNGQAAPFRVIADHLRTLSFAIADGAQPSNTDRGYVLRKILRRAVRYGRQLNGIQEPFLADLLPSLIEVMGDDYPELKTAQQRIAELLTVEEEAFQRVLRRGKHLLSAVIERSATKGVVSGDDAFTLKDTYGFPLDEIALIAKDADLTVDNTRFTALEEEARARSRAAHTATHQVADANLFSELEPSEFIGYDNLTGESVITGLIHNEVLVDKLEEGQEGLILLASTPFYAEKGGQVGDTGEIVTNGNLFEVQNTQTPYPDVIVHSGLCKTGSFAVGDRILATIDGERRQAIANNHTATHLLHWALQRVLGDHVRQAGSVVDENRLRFDFNHHKAVTPEQLREIEDLVNAKIRHNRAVQTYELSYDAVQKRNDIKQFFGDKYGSHVRVVDIDYSKELCGGTHTNATGTIGLCRIVKESSIAAGIRRLEAVTGDHAEAFARESEDRLNDLAKKFKVPVPKLEARLEKLLEENQELKNSLNELKKASRGSALTDLLRQVTTVNDLQLLTAAVDLSAKELRPFADEAFAQLKDGILILGVAEGERCQLLVRCSPTAISKGIEAKKIIAEISPIIGGRGGGKADSAQAGGTDPSQLQAALQCGAELVEKLGASTTSP